MTLLVLLFLFGAASGILSGWSAAYKSRGILNAIFRSLFLTVFMPLLFLFLIGLFSDQPEGFSFVNAVFNGFGGMFFLGIGIVVNCAPASIVAAIISYVVFSRCCLKQEALQDGRGHGG